MRPKEKQKEDVTWALAEKKINDTVTYTILCQRREPSFDCFCKADLCVSHLYTFS